MSRSYKKLYSSFEPVYYDTPLTYRPNPSAKLILVMEQYGLANNLNSNILKLYDDQFYSIEYNGYRRIAGRMQNDNYDSVIYLLNNLNNVTTAPKPPCCDLWYYRLLYPKGVELGILSDLDYSSDVYQPLSLLQELFN